jgi:hypothetical protein
MVLSPAARPPPMSLTGLSPIIQPPALNVVPQRAAAWAKCSRSGLRAARHLHL